jgi:hypothetical protein
MAIPHWTFDKLVIGQEIAVDTGYRHFSAQFGKVTRNTKQFIEVTVTRHDSETKVWKFSKATGKPLGLDNGFYRDCALYDADEARRILKWQADEQAEKQFRNEVKRKLEEIAYEGVTAEALRKLADEIDAHNAAKQDAAA